LKERGEMTAAMEIFQKGLQEDPYHCPLYQVLGHSVSHFGASHVDRALIRSRRHTHHYSALNPSSIYFLTNSISNQAFGMLLAELGRTDAARSIFERGTQTNPRGRHVYYIWHAWAVMEEKSGESGLLLSSPLSILYRTWIVGRIPRSTARQIIQWFALVRGGEDRMA
jgi:tetratricopeptide (TPR) repeat protein